MMPTRFRVYDVYKQRTSFIPTFKNTLLANKQTLRRKTDAYYIHLK